VRPRRLHRASSPVNRYGWASCSRDSVHDACR
jgi:hypothetical protein